QEAYEVPIVHRLDVAQREAVDLHRLEQVGFLQLLDDRADANRRFDVPPLAHVMDLVGVADRERDFPRSRPSRRRRLARAGLEVPRLAERELLVAERLDDAVRVARRDAVAVAALEDRPDDLPRMVALGRDVLAERVE